MSRTPPPMECPRCNETDARSIGMNVCGLCECHFYVGKSSRGGWMMSPAPASMIRQIKNALASPKLAADSPLTQRRRSTDVSGL